MAKRNEKTTERPASQPSSLGDDVLKNVAGGSLHPVFPPGQFPSKGTPGWKPGWFPPSN